VSPLRREDLELTVPGDVHRPGAEIDGDRGTKELSRISVRAGRRRQEYDEGVEGLSHTWREGVEA
jgi:hypothetical protein